MGSERPTHTILDHSVHVATQEGEKLFVIWSVFVAPFHLGLSDQSRGGGDEAAGLTEEDHRGAGLNHRMGRPPQAK